MIWIDYVNMVAAVVTAVAALFATIFGLKQYSQSKELEFEDKRAFIVPRLAINKEEKIPRV